MFFGKRKTAIKVLFFDGSGMCLFYKRADAHAREGLVLLKPRWAISLMLGPMTRTEIRKAREQVGSAEEADDTTVRTSEPKPTQTEERAS